ncbi:response regulator transcription factor [Flavobacterium sp. DG1-102-2]|uniref:LytR/AlgR family response regulator transcription factor n=1 Tax=Flavobacterium sp. DG1-102-2 TaxID=3081663 RepID=UPI00294920EB|nr:response regulator transcription factor [Flavobacterium sp. DG1-102-2]MDV6169736.1 response regulator transcription factor [Flavobacterium sp. DG1-102-2]
MNTKIKCLLLDDELPGLTFLKMVCEQIDELEVVKAYNSPEKLLAEWEGMDFDLLITDIEMPGINGLQVADAIKGKAIIFTTAYKNFAVDAFDKDAIDYVVKPIKPERLKHAIEKVSAHMAKAEAPVKQIQLNTDKGKALISAAKIFAAVTSNIDSRDKILFLNDGVKITVKNSSFEKLLELLPENEFSRINKKAIIALKHVQFYSHDEITADLIYTDGKPYTFPLSEIYRNDFMKRVKN